MTTKEGRHNDYNLHSGVLYKTFLHKHVCWRENYGGCQKRFLRKPFVKGGLLLLSGKSSCFHRTFNESHPAFGELSTKVILFFTQLKKQSFCRAKLQILALRKGWGFLLRSPKGSQPMPGWSMRLKQFTQLTHTLYLSLPLHRQDFQIPNCTPKNN